MGAADPRSWLSTFNRFSSHTGDRVDPQPELVRVRGDSTEYVAAQLNRFPKVAVDRISR